jgi:nucleoside-diphosphate-sugar epimerase
MRVLVTGGAGFIGSWTGEALVEAGHEVMVYDSFVTGHAEYLGRVLDRVPVLRGDVRQALALQRAVRRFQPHVIVHLAACVSVPLSLQRALRSHDENTRGTLAVLEAARANEVRRVVFASSAAVYGRNPAVPLREEATLAPLSPYALHKLIGEQYARLYSELYGLETVALRYFNVYGPRQDPASPYSGVIARFAEAAREGKPVAITGDGTQTRDFVFVGDVARVNVAAATTELGGHHVVNVGTGRETSLLELRAAIEEIVKRPLRHVFAPPRPGDVGRSCANVTALQHLFGLTCTTSLADGLATLLTHQAQEFRTTS